MLPEPLSAPNREAQRPKTSVPPLFLARASNQVPTKSKGKAKAKPKANSVAGLLSVASFFKTSHKHPPRFEEERKHARQVNAARAAEGLASKSTGSVSRSKARALTRS